MRTGGRRPRAASGCGADAPRRAGRGTGRQRRPTTAPYPVRAPHRALCCGPQRAPPLCCGAMKLRTARPTAIAAVVLLALATAMPAQEGKGKKPAKPKKGDTPVAAAPDRKDDAVTAKDKAIAAIDDFLGKHSPAKKTDNWRCNMSTPPLQKFTPGFDYFWHLRTNKGEITIRFLADVAPMHVTSAIYLTRAGFYDGLKFNRVIKGFMAQGGCPLGTGSGGPGYQLEGEFAESVKHDRPGLLSAANAGPRTDGSQFFLTFAKEPHLDGMHTIYGEVKDGMNVVEAFDACGGDEE